ncbi:MAG: type II toxin-antitoxin system RatA family toxin [Rhodospirillales bacterium]|nr:type II toxin-antitoxin system RatA family toxin [Alphaproteobacteria bacterium]MBL6947801.1 type II toxin-antitoxin system RatA family toxin [Rhodospirillales bacterium]
MPTHAEKRLLHHTPEQLFDLVADVGRYPEFLPWCAATRIRETGEEDGVDLLIADMVIGYKMFREKFTTKVLCQRPGRIDVSYYDGPFKYLNNHWIFEAQDNGECMIDFYVDFEFKSRFFQAAIGAVFNEAVKRMIRAFEKRADDLYGK